MFFEITIIYCARFSGLNRRFWIFFLNFVALKKKWPGLCLNGARSCSFELNEFKCDGLIFLNDVMPFNKVFGMTSRKLLMGASSHFEVMLIYFRFFLTCLFFEITIIYRTRSSEFESVLDIFLNLCGFEKETDSTLLEWSKKL